MAEYEVANPPENGDRVYFIIRLAGGTLSSHKGKYCDADGDKEPYLRKLVVHNRQPNKFFETDTIFKFSECLLWITL